MHPDARARLVEALAFALDAHGVQTRKGRDIPYASHLLQVAGLVLEHGGDTELAVAALREVMKFLPAGADRVPSTALMNMRGKTYFNKDVRRFQRGASDGAGVRMGASGDSAKGRAK